MNSKIEKDFRNQISDTTPNCLHAACEHYETCQHEQAMAFNTNKGNGGNVYVNNHMAAGSNMTQNNGTIINNCGMQHEMASHDAFREAVKTLIQQNLITHKQDFAIPYQLEMEMNELGVESAPQMVKLVKSVPNLPDSLRPSDSNIKSFDPGRKIYPNWEFGDMDYGQVSHKKTVAKHYIREMAKYGFVHPCLETSLNCKS